MYIIVLQNGLRIQTTDKEMQAVVRMLAKNNIHTKIITHKNFWRG